LAAGATIKKRVRKARERPAYKGPESPFLDPGSAGIACHAPQPCHASTLRLSQSSFKVTNHGKATRASYESTRASQQR
jgi:hypothetical protein